MNQPIQQSARQAWPIAPRIALCAVVGLWLVAQSLFANEQIAEQIETAMGNRGIAHALNKEFAVTVQIHKVPAETIQILVTLDEKLRNKVEAVFLKVRCDDAEAIRKLKELPSLRSLHVDENAWHPAIAEVIGESKTINDVWAGGAGLTGKDLKLIGQVRQMKCLMIDGNPFTARDVAHLSKLAQLTQLSLSGSEIRTDDVAWLSSMTNLSALWLSDTNVDDSLVAVLAPCKGIHLLALTRTRVTSKGAEQLRKQHPKAIVSAGGGSEEETIALPKK